MARVVKEHTPPTAEEIQRVRVEECRQLNHDFQVVQAFQDEGPTHVICGRCGREWHMSSALRRRLDAVLDELDVDGADQDEPGEQGGVDYAVSRIRDVLP